MSDDETSKVCTTCKLRKPLDGFHVNRTGKFGRAAACRDCSNERHRVKFRDDLGERQRQRARSAAYRAALEELRRKHPVEFKAIHATIRHQKGLG